MVISIERPTASFCARRLATALGNGSQEEVSRALQGIASLNSRKPRDSREIEFRELLDGIAEPFRVSPGLVAQDAARRSTALRMLNHVARAAV